MKIYFKKILSFLVVFLVNNITGMESHYYTGNTKSHASIRINDSNFSQQNNSTFSNSSTHKGVDGVGNNRSYEAWETTSHGMRTGMSNSRNSEQYIAQTPRKNVDSKILHTKAHENFTPKVNNVSDQESTKLHIVFSTGSSDKLKNAKKDMIGKALGVWFSEVSRTQEVKRDAFYGLANQAGQMEGLRTTTLLFAAMNGNLELAEAAVHEVKTRKLSRKSQQIIDFDPVKAVQEVLQARPDYQRKVKTQQERLNYNIHTHALKALDKSASRTEFVGNLIKVVDTVLDNAHVLDYDVHPEVDAQINNSLDALAHADSASEFAFHLATVDHLVKDLLNQPTAAEHTAELALRAVQKYWENLSPTETEISLVCDLAKYVSDFTTGTSYLSQEVRDQRIQQFWDTVDKISLENIKQLTAEDFVDGAMYVTARITWFTGIGQAIKMVKNFKNVSTLGQTAAVFAGRMLDKLDSVIGANPAMVTADGVVIVQPVATEAEIGYVAAVASYFKDNFWGPDKDKIKNTDQLLKKEADIAKAESAAKKASQDIIKNKQEVLDHIKAPLSDLVKNGNRIKQMAKDVFKVEHVFTKRHVLNGLLKIGTAKEIAVRCVDLAKSLDQQNLLMEGMNTIRTYVDGTPFEVHVFMQGDLLRSFNAFAGHSARIVGNLIIL